MALMVWSKRCLSCRPPFVGCGVIGSRAGRLISPLRRWIALVKNRNVDGGPSRFPAMIRRTSVRITGTVMPGRSSHLATSAMSACVPSCLPLGPVMPETGSTPMASSIASRSVFSASRATPPPPMTVPDGSGASAAGFDRICCGVWGASAAGVHFVRGAAYAGFDVPYGASAAGFADRK